MKCLTLGLVMTIFMTGVSTTALTNETEHVTQNNAAPNSDESGREQDFIDIKHQPAAINKDQLTDVYEYEEASLKILKYFGFSVMSGSIVALGCFIITMLE